MKTDPITIEIKLKDGARVGNLIDEIFSDMSRIIVTVTDRKGYSCRYGLHSADELKNAPKNECLLFFLREGDLYEGKLKSIEEKDNMIVIKTLDDRFSFGLPMSGLLGWVWISRTQIL